MGSDKLLVAFPGKGYTCETGLLAAGITRYRELGYEVLALDYPGVDFAALPSLTVGFDRAEAAARPQLDRVDWGRYGDVVFLSKSLGTVVAARTLRRTGVPARSLYLTPLPETLPLVQPGDRVLAMVSGEADRYIDWHVVRDFCAARQIPFCLAPGVGHRLADPHSPAATAAIEQAVLKFCR